MKKITLEKMENLNGEASGRDCMILGGLAFAAALGQQWGAAIGITGAATLAGCFDVY